MSFTDFFLGTLTLIFITLKLAGVGIIASWSWILVLSPIWFPVVAFIVLGFLVGLFLHFKEKF